MSEYQYYEFRVVDRPLTEEQMNELRSYSSRAQISPDSFVNVYNWGNFKGDPHTWMEKYFDAFLYLANWGSRILMLRVPTRLLDPNTARKYCSDEYLSCRAKGDHLIFSFHSEDEDSDWEDGEGWLASLVQLRSDLMHGDYRCLYLGWLLAAQGGGLDDDAPEPPLPPGLGTLNAPLRSLADFLRIDRDLIAAAAEESAEKPACRLSPEEIHRWVAVLPSKEKDDLLTRLLGDDDSHLVAELRLRALRAIRGEGTSGRDSQTGGPRSVVSIVARAEVIGKQRQKQEMDRQSQEKARRERAQAEERRKRLESLAGKESDLWVQVDRLIAAKQPKRYDEAVSLLKDLHDLADMKGTGPEFARRMSVLCREHERKPSLVDRLHKANLWG